jgi:hypothetical protein
MQYLQRHLSTIDVVLVAIERVLPGALWVLRDVVFALDGFSRKTHDVHARVAELRCHSVFGSSSRRRFQQNRKAQRG